MRKKGILIIFLLSMSYLYSENFISYKIFKRPYKPYKFDSPYEEDKFFTEVDTYKEEIEAYILEQEEAIRRHEAARDAAREEWNDFAKYELEDPSKQIRKK